MTVELTRPAKLPEWASQDIVDPTSGVNNVVEPSEAKKDLGHGPLGEFPPRQYQNWLQRIIYNWFQWVTETIGIEQPFYGLMKVPDMTGDQKVTGWWRRTNRGIIIHFDKAYGASDNTECNIYPDPDENVEWPRALVEKTDQGTKVAFPIADTDGTTKVKIGMIEIPAGTTTPFKLWYPDSNGVLALTNFTASGSKGVEESDITYIRHTDDV